MSTQSRSYQSLRSSCERCRFQKLRCTLASDPESPTLCCQRCLRAKVSCVFSRRARSGPYPKKQESLDLQAAKPHVVEKSPSTPTSESSITSPLAWTGKAPTSSAESFILEHHGPPHLDTTAPDGSLYDHSSSDGALFNSAGVDWWSHSDSLTPEVGLPDDFKLVYRPTSSPEEPQNMETGDGLLYRDSFLDASAVDSVMMGIPQPQESTTQVPGLTALLLEMHSYLRVLQDYRFPNAAEAEERLNDYPIGDVLYLSQWFCTILSCCGTSFGERNVSDSPIDNNAFNTPTLLLILSCYISMTHLYSIVFGHLEDFLVLLPASAPLPAPLEPRRGLRLGQLPLVNNETCARTQRAVGTLLDALCCAESFIGLPRGSRDPEDAAGAGAWSLEGGLVLTLLKQENLAGAVREGVEDGVKEGLSELRVKIERVRELLRGRLDLS